jgi:hypothetical protein
MEGSSNWAPSIASAAMCRARRIDVGPVPRSKEAAATGSMLVTWGRLRRRSADGYGPRRPLAGDASRRA